MNEYRLMNEVFRIVNGALRLDVEKVRNYTAFLAEKLEKQGDTGSAMRLRRLLEETDHQLRPLGASAVRASPVDSETRFPLVEKVNLKAFREPPIVLDEQQRAAVGEFLSVAKSHSQIEAEGISASSSLLVYGPPGCGKSRLARFIASELGLELWVARLDGLISSYLGSTSKNIRALFDFASKNPCILFLDEFDAIAKLRGDTQELGELKRVVNSFLQNLDSLGPQSIVVAATNHETLLDSAVWRRFSYRLHLGFPVASMRAAMWTQFLTPIELTTHDVEMLVDLSDGFSGSDIQEVCLRLHRRRITRREEATVGQAFEVLQNLSLGEGEERRFLSAFKAADRHSIALKLRERNPKLYSHAGIAQRLGVSKATAHRWALKGVEEHA